MNSMKFAIAILLQSCIFFTSAQAIKNTSYISASGEKVLSLETVLPVNKATCMEIFHKRYFTAKVDCALGSY